MELAFPGLYFLTSSIPLKFNTDGYTTSFQPAAGPASGSDHVLVLTNIQAGMFGLKSVKDFSLFDTISVPGNFQIPEVAEVMQKEIEALNAPIINLSSHISDYHDTVAAISLVDAFISVDTGIVHAARALGVPGVTLFGPFPPATHVSDYLSVTGFRAEYKGKACSGPCLETHRGCAEVDFSPERISPCFEALTLENVIEALEKVVN